MIDSTSGQPIPMANVALQGTILGAVTNSAGFFHIAAIPEGRYRLVISHLGHIPRTVDVEVTSERITEVSVSLAPTDLKAQEIVVTGERPKRIDESRLRMQSISAQEVNMVPAGAEPDIFRALQANPGVGTTSDVSARYYVRGGASDQNLVLLNGATVYSPFHTLGIFSVVDPEVVSVLEFHKGAFPPSYGGRLSSVLNIVTRDGNRNALQGVASASLLSGKLAVEGPVPDGSFILQGRKSWYAGLMRRYLNNHTAPFNFYDAAWKLSYANAGLDKNSSFAVHGFVSGDEVLNEDPNQEDYAIRNRIVGLNWRKIWSTPLYSVVSVSYSGFDADVRPNQSSAKPRSNSVSDVTADWDFTYLFDNRDELNFGWQNKILSTTLSLENLFGSRYEYEQRGGDVSAYADYRFYTWETVSLTVGVRFKFVALAKVRPGLFEPRASLTYKPEPWLALRVAAGFYSQEMMTVSDESELVSIFEPWIITPDYLFTPRTFHLSTGLKVDWLNILTSEVEAYYNPVAKVAVENPKKFMPSDRDFINADAESYGLEVLTQYTGVETYARMSYALSWASTTINGQRVVPRYDIRHSLGALVGTDLGNDWQASVSWTLRSGMPFTPIAGYFDRSVFDPWSPPYEGGPSEPVTLWGTKNAARMPIYHRMDVSVTKRVVVGGANVSVGASVINLYDQKNILYFERDTGRRIYMLRFLPSVSLRVQV